MDISRVAWANVRRLALGQGVVVADGPLTLGREEAARVSHALRSAGTLDETARRVLVVLGKGRGLLVTGAA